ncbi:MAG TPA: Os1348 family NHLP clan protein [Chloroflexota bacterium]|nr:Os1348 family NHLP clan protein [Chloroflexota bacterium]
MSAEAVERLMRRWVDEPEFRAELCANAEAAARRHGFDLCEEEWTALRHFDWWAAEEELAAV